MTLRSQGGSLRPHWGGHILPKPSKRIQGDRRPYFLNLWPETKQLAWLTPPFESLQFERYQSLIRHHGLSLTRSPLLYELVSWLEAFLIRSLHFGEVQRLKVSSGAGFRSRIFFSLLASEMFASDSGSIIFEPVESEGGGRILNALQWIKINQLIKRLSRWNQEIEAQRSSKDKPSIWLGSLLKWQKLISDSIYQSACPLVFPSLRSARIGSSFTPQILVKDQRWFWEISTCRIYNFHAQPAHFGPPNGSKPEFSWTRP